MLFLPGPGSTAHLTGCIQVELKLEWKYFSPFWLSRTVIKILTHFVQMECTSFLKKKKLFPKKTLICVQISLFLTSLSHLDTLIYKKPFNTLITIWLYSRSALLSIILYVLDTQRIEMTFLPDPR